MTDLCNFTQMFMTFWNIFGPTVTPYTTSALKEMWRSLFTYLSRKQLYKLISKYDKCRVVIDKDDTHEHIELDMNK